MLAITTRFRVSYSSALLFAGSLAAHGAIALSIRAPTVYEDEYVFMGLARMLGGAGLEPDLNKYYPALSFILAPIYTVVSDQQVAYRAAQVLNTILISLVAPLAFYIFRHLATKASHGSSVLVGVLATAYPAYLITHAIVWSEALTAAAVMAVGAFGIYVWTAPTQGRLFLLGLVAGLTVMTHQRTVTIPIALVMVLTYLWFNRQIRLGQLVWPTIGVIVGGTVTLVALYVASVPIMRPGIVDDATSRTIPIAEQVTNFASMLVGQAFYLVAASGGLVAIAVVCAISAAPRFRRGTVEPAAFVSLFFVTAAILTLIVSAGFLRNGDRRGDFAIYGRYTEILMIPLIVVGIAYLWGIASHWSRIRLLGTTVGSIAALGAATIALRGWIVELPVAPINIVALAPAILPSSALDYRVALAIGLALGLIVATWLAHPNKRVLAVTALVAVWLTAFVFAYRPVQLSSDRADQRSRIAEEIASRDTRLGSVTPCIAYLGSITPLMYYHYAFQLAPRVLERSDPDACSQFLITIDEQGIPPGARLLTIDSTVPDGLHRMLWLVESG